MTSGPALAGSTPPVADHRLSRRPLAPEDEAKTVRAAKDFEAMTLDQMLQPMFATLDADPLFGGGQAEKTLQPMLVTEMAKLMEQRGGLGLSQAISDKMMQMQERGS